jgi:FlaA1/EpsC-like NDP-sugar epimerase
MIHQPRRDRLVRPSASGLGDALTWLPAVALAAWLRLDGEWEVVPVRTLVQFAVVAFVLHFVLTLASSWFRGSHVAGAMDDVLDVVATLTLTGTVLFAIGLLGLITVPRSLALIALLVTIPLAVGPRVVRRLVRERRVRPDERSARRVVVFGAGWGGQQVVRSMLGEGDSGYLPVALLDDAPDARGRRISGVPVLGGRHDIATVAARTGAELLVVAIRDLDVTAMRQVSSLATAAGLQVKVIPSLGDLFRPWVGLSDLEDLDIADLIGRTPIEVDVSSIAGYLSGRRVLVTGAGGSIGSELCRQVHRFGPSALLMLDRDESALHALQLSISGRALLDSPDTILADIRDAPTLRRIMLERRPDVVFHAAALKHLPMLEQYPDEAWQTNVVGTVNVLEAALEAGVPRFVNISTDKAANPTSVLGMSKRIGERLVAGVADRVDAESFVSVRFGNVLGSRGSVLTTFAEQIASGQPITVTHPDVTRFFMTIPEAVRLVVQAGGIGRPGEALVLDMGAPVRILDVARQLTALAGRSVQILYTGLRDGEKLHEELFGFGETDVRPVHPQVSHVDVPPLNRTIVPIDVPAGRAVDAMVALLATTVPPDPRAAAHGDGAALAGGEQQ